MCECNPEFVDVRVDDYDDLMEAKEFYEKHRWQPIETAPKDGTDILICGGTWFSEVDYKGSPNKEVRLVYWYDTCDEEDRCWAETGGTYYMSWITNPSYWAPVLQPLSETKTE